MYLTKRMTTAGPRWALDGKLLPQSINLAVLLAMRKSLALHVLRSAPTAIVAHGDLAPPVDSNQEVWASGVTYYRSREARRAESQAKDVYEKVYSAARPELFFKLPGWRVVGQDGAIRIRGDSRWNVPEPELTLVVNNYQEILGFTAGNDVSSRDIEGENPLYLPQAKVYNGSCALGPGILVVDDVGLLEDLRIALEVWRGDALAFRGDTNTTLIQRSFEELIAYLFRELTFPSGVLLMTGTGIVPPDGFTLEIDDRVVITVGDLSLENVVTR
jgi:2-dehydro-3-deoxy-D-arabinonate dehydratase